VVEKQGRERHEEDKLANEAVGWTLAEQNPGSQCPDDGEHSGLDDRIQEYAADVAVAQHRTG
jgi:hypothetical protein